MGEKPYAFPKALAEGWKSLWPLPSAIFSFPNTKRRQHLGSNNSQSNTEALMTNVIFRSPNHRFPPIPDIKEKLLET